MFIFLITIAFATTYGFEGIPYECNPNGLGPGDCKWSQWTECVFPKKNISQQFAEILENIEGLGCKGLQTPADQMILLGFKYYSDFLINSPLHDRLQQLPGICGRCGIRLRCCKNADQFMSQALDGSECTDPSAQDTCRLVPLTSDEILAHHKKHPDWPHLSLNTCDFNQFLPVHKLQGLNTTTVTGRLVCSLFSTVNFQVNCINVLGACHCCCNQFIPVPWGKCIPDPLPTENVCRREQQRDC